MFSASKSVSSFESDPYWENTVLLLNGASASNGAQNNTIMDSAYNRVVTSNGTPIQGSVSPYGNLWSNYFSGSGQNLALPSNTALDMGSGSFTLEFWLFPNSVSGSAHVISQQAQDLTIQFGNTLGDQLLIYDGSNRIIGSVSPNTWTHVAIVRNGSTLQGYLNGVASGSSWTNSSSTRFSFSNAIIAARWGSANYYNGYLSNLRIVKGTALYTSNFTPSTTPLTTVSGTSLLTCQSNRFKDNSSNNFAITPTGTPSVSKFSPVMDANVITSGSVYLNGSSDYLSLTSDYNSVANIGINLTPGSTNFTVEFWVYPTSTANGILFSTGYGAGGRIVVSLSSMAVNVTIWTGSASTTGGSTTATLPLNAWSHVAIGRASTLYQVIYINGVRDKRFTVSFPTMTEGTLGIGAHSDGTGTKFAGYITDVRYSANSWIYTDPVAESSFPLPTSPLTKLSTTTALLNMTNAGIVDQTDLNNLRTVGDAQVSTVVKKYGNGSMYFDGSGDYLTTPSSVNFGFGTGNFTIECWAYFASVSTQQNFIDLRSTAGSTAPILYITATGVVNYSVGGAALISSAANAVSATTWTHIALSRSSGSSKIFVNGVQVGSTATDSTNFAATIVAVGAVFNGTNPMNGYIDDLRITTGVARYTANFTAPHRSLPVMPNVRDNIPSYFAVKQYDYSNQTTATAKVKLLSDKRPIAFISNSSVSKIGFQVYNQNGTLSGASYTVTPTGTFSGSMDIDENDNVYVGGGTLLTKTNLSGTVAWAITGFPTTHYISDVSYKAGKLAVSISTNNSTYWADSYLMYINASDGSVVWSRKITAPSQRCQFGYSGIDQDANPFIGGLWGFYYASLVKFDTLGNLLWNKHFGFDSTGISVNENTGFSIVASYGPAAVRVYDRSGNVVTGFSYSPTGSPFITPMVYIDDDGTFVVGGAEPANPSNAYSLFLIRHDADGSMLWKKAYAGSNTANTGDITAYRISRNQNNDIIVTGTSSSDSVFMVISRDTGEILSSSSTWVTVGTNVQLSAATSLTAQTVTVASFTPTLSSTTATFAQSSGTLIRTS